MHSRARFYNNEVRTRSGSDGAFLIAGRTRWARSLPLPVLTLFLRHVREFGWGLRVIRCKAKRGEAPSSRGSKDARKSRPPVASTATAELAIERGRFEKGETKMKRTAYTM